MLAQAGSRYDYAATGNNWKRMLLQMYRRLLSSKRQALLRYSATKLKARTAEEAVDNILFNTVGVKENETSHVLCALVSNEPGVLSRVSGVLASRGFNIDSLVVSSTEVPDLSRMTIRLKGQHAVIDKARKQLDDLVPVWAVLDYTKAKKIEREMLLVKVSTVGQIGVEEEQGSGKKERIYETHLKRQALKELAELFQAKVVDIGTEHVIIELAAKSSRIDAFVQLVKPYGIIESSRSGVMVMGRSPVSGIGIPDEDDEEEDEGETVNLAALPPS